MKCHYEVLGVARTAGDDDIKKAYRKLALRWHPDKNLDNREEANQQFLLVQAAYDVLSDMHERAWYDNHREQILRGGHTDYEDKSLDVYQFFTTSCYKGYGDDPGGFYAVYADVFHKLATEEVEFLETEEEFESIPKFGDSQSDYETVVRLFYGYWEGYCTKKSYAWLNPHNVAEIRDRRILKAIEKENKKVQQKARKERNEEIRSLVLFVKKRDRRVQAYKKLLEERATQNRLKSQQNRLEQIRRHQQEIEQQQRNSSNHFNEAYEEQLQKLEASYAGSSEEESEEDEEDGANGLEGAMAGLNVSQDENGEESFYLDDLYCVACDKMFTNRNSFENHESSRKHRQNVELLRRQMREESTNQDEPSETGVEEGEAGLSAEEVASGEEPIEEEVKKEAKSKSKKNKSKKKAFTSIPVIKPSDDDEEEDGDGAGESKMPKEEDDMTGLRLGRKGAGVLDASDDEPHNWDAGNGKKSKKGKGKAKGDAGASKATKAGAVPTVKDEPAVSDTVNQEPTIKKANSKAKAGHSDDEEANSSTDLSCVTCNVKFPSKNKLFDHLKKTGHSVYIDKLKAPKTAGKAEGSAKGKRKGK
ncbi:dnaJ homolog subfamily C member 21 [Anopheles darlingi]|uniref:dnaJ homolog subfamily C member 21 n=1 Tax=Anopheles darlingi TaxID=43151 RepID=UPI0021004B39|nr:dnaJ homolog subfamily C member 21 [Anopheles darlingi]